MARASLATRAQRVNMAIRMLRRAQSPKAILLLALSKAGAISRRQAYRYLIRAQGRTQLQPVPQPRSVFTVNLPTALIQEVRRRCRQQNRRISHVVAEVLERWLDRQRHHG